MTTKDPKAVGLARARSKGPHPREGARVVKSEDGTMPHPEKEPEMASESAHRPAHAKRTLTTDNIAYTIRNRLISTPTLTEAVIRPKLSAALREKIFLAVTSINDCRYCKWGHSHFALAQGVSLDEVNQIFSGQLEALSAANKAEAAAILFAQQYAEHLDEISEESLAHLRKYYTDAEIAEILGYVRFITLTNLTGNTVDAFLERLRGGLVEGAVGALMAPLAILLAQLARNDSRVRMDPLRSSDKGPRASGSVSKSDDEGAER